MKTRTLRHDVQGPRPEPRTPVLVGRASHGGWLVVELGPRTTIGRAPDADVVIDADGISRHHARFELDDEGTVEVHDLESKNGTLVNGSAVTRHRLQPGDVVEVGAVKLELRLAAPAELALARRAADAWKRLSPLSTRELEVARLVAAGRKSAQIGEQLGITTRTVNTHLEHVFERLGVRSRTVLARLVIEAGLLDSD